MRLHRQVIDLSTPIHISSPETETRLMRIRLWT